MDGAFTAMASSNPEFPFYYDNSYWVIRVHERGQREARYLGEKKGFASIQGARQFSSLISAHRTISRLDKGSGLYEVESITDKIGPLYPLPEEITDLILQIPSPYMYAAMAWFEGEDVGAGLKINAPRTYYRYRKKLLEFGIDIAKPSTVVVLRT